MLSLNTKCSKQKGENFYLRNFGGEHKEAGSAGDYDTEKEERGGANSKHSVLDNWKL